MTKQTIELKKCPCCGSDARLDVKRGVTGLACRTGYYRAYVHCKKKSCGLRTKIATRPGKAEALWNTRVED